MAGDGEGDFGGGGRKRGMRELEKLRENGS